MKLSLERQHNKRTAAKKIRRWILNRLTTEGLNKENFTIERAYSILARDNGQNFYTNYLQKNSDKIYRGLA